MRHLPLVFLFLGPAAFAYGTPDGATPSQETVCDGETGAAYGLCTAYCEAMDCDLEEGFNASQTACDAVRANYQTKTGHDVPCEDGDTGGGGEEPPPA